MLGGVFNYRLHNHWSVGLEFNWMRKTAGNTVFASRDTVNALESTYLEFPALLTFMVPASDKWDFGFYSGIDFAVRAKCEVVLTNGVRKDATGEILGGAPVKTEWSWPMGVAMGYYIPNSKSVVVVLVRYSVSLTDILEDANVRYKSWQFLVRYAFPL